MTMFRTALERIASDHGKSDQKGSTKSKTFGNSKARASARVTAHEDGHYSVSPENAEPKHFEDFDQASEHMEGILGVPGGEANEEQMEESAAAKPGSKKSKLFR